MDKSVIILTFQFIKAGLILSAHWETKPADEIYACQGENVEFPWQLNTDPHYEFLENMHWLFHNISITDLIATHLYGQFFPSPDYAGRVSQWQQSGVTIHNVTQRDTGNYSVEVEVRRSNESNFSHMFSHSVHLRVSDGLLVEEGRLKVAQESVVIWNVTSRQWLIRLTCGVFLSKDSPPMYVEWIFPNGETRTSDGYDGGHFYLYLSLPMVMRGNYTCRIPPQFFSQVCASEGHSEATEQSIGIDDIRARLVLSEAEQNRLRLDNERLEITVDNLNNTLNDMQNHMAQVLQSFREEIQAACNSTQHKDPPAVDLPSICMDMNYTIINDVAGIRNLHNSTNGSLCDNMKLGWYRWFLGGQDAVIPTACTPDKRCGTSATMWIDLRGQSLPAVGHEVQALVCPSYDSVCCHSDWSPPRIVTIRNCGGFFVYLLDPHPTCYLAYCLQIKV